MLRINKHAALVSLICCSGFAQTSGKIHFDVVSVKRSRSNDAQPNSTFPLGPGSVYTKNGGHFSARNYPVAAYVSFAYKFMGNQLQDLHLPDWTYSEQYDIEARTDGDPSKDTKDQMRLMMQALLADRFKLGLHTETRQAPVYGMVVAKAGKLGRSLKLHPNDSSCAGTPPPTQVAGQFPALCGGLLQMPERTPGQIRFGGRNITLAFIGNSLANIGMLDRPVIDKTGLAGTYDFAIEFEPERGGRGGEAPTAPSGPVFLDALNQQLGLKLESQKGPVEGLVLDHIERPSQN